MSATIPLPDRPNLEQLKKQAREASKALGVKLSEAQFHVAQGYGFASWPKLKKHVELVTQLTRTPDTVAPSSEPADEFLRLACLCYSDTDSPAKRAAASAMLNPDLASRDIWIASATASVDAVRRLVANNRSLASTEGGPFKWEPLMYLAYARFEPTPSEADTLATANALLDAGADPNAGYLWYGLPSPFTVLGGVLGEGEMGPENQPPHPHALALARVLLERGADPNDNQALYNRQFEPGADHLKLLFEFGLGQGDGGPWKAKLTAALDPSAEMLRQQLRWAIHHRMQDRVRLLAGHGVDVLTPFDDERLGHCHGRTPAQWAALSGDPEIAREIDATWQPLTPVDEFVGTIMRGDRAALVPGAIEDRPSLVVQATATGNPAAVESAVAAGFDINALGRADSPCEQPWQTALHTAVDRDDAEMVQLLLRLGADPSIQDPRFNSTPQGWAAYLSRDRMAALLP